MILFNFVILIFKLWYFTIQPFFHQCVRETGSHSISERDLWLLALLAFLMHICRSVLGPS